MNAMNIMNSSNCWFIWRKNVANRVYPSSWNGNDLFISALYSFVDWVQREGAAEMSTLSYRMQLVEYKITYIILISWIIEIRCAASTATSTPTLVAIRCCIQIELNIYHHRMCLCSCWFVFLYLCQVSNSSMNTLKTTKRHERIGESGQNQEWMRKLHTCTCQIYHIYVIHPHLKMTTASSERERLYVCACVRVRVVRITV